MLAGLFLLLAAGRLTEAQVTLQREAGERLYLIMEETLAEASRRLKAGEPLTVGALRAVAESGYRREGLVTDEPVIVAVDGQAGDPAFQANRPEQTVGRGDLLLVDLCARRDAPGGVYADLTWSVFAGRRADLPARVERAWQAVKGARDAALSLLEKGLEGGAPPPADRLDEAARLVIVKAGLGGYFPHPAGHSLGEKPFGEGPNLLAGEMRPIGDGECVAIEPGVYYPGELGVRSEIDVCVQGHRAEVTSGNPQREVRCLLD